MPVEPVFALFCRPVHLNELQLFHTSGQHIWEKVLGVCLLEHSLFVGLVFKLVFGPLYYMLSADLRWRLVFFIIQT